MCPSHRCLALLAPLLLACPSGGPNTSESMPDLSTGTDAATQDITTGCEVGMAGCPCTNGGACDPGLVCGEDLVCFDPEHDTTSGTGSTTSLESMTDAMTEDSQTSLVMTDPPGPPCTGDDINSESNECLTLDPSRPFCVENMCTGCTALPDPDQACAMATGGERSVCHPAGYCVQCNDVDALTEGQCKQELPHCNLDTNMCEGCREHSECPDSACDIAARKCFPTDKVLYVRAGPTPNSPCTEMVGAGKLDTPYCDFQTALDTAKASGFSTGWTFYVLPSDTTFSTSPITITPSDIKISYAFVHEPGLKGASQSRLTGFGPVIVVPANVTLYLDDFAVLVDKPLGDSSTGIECLPGGRVWLSDSRVQYARGPNILGYQCEVVLERSSVVDGETEGIDLTGGKLTLLNSFVGKNGFNPSGGGGLVLRYDNDNGTGPTVDIAYSTIVNNAQPPGDTSSDTILCESEANITIRNSILARQAGPNHSVHCPDASLTVSGTVADQEFPGDNEVRAAEDIVNALHYTPSDGTFRFLTPASAEPFRLQGTWKLGDPHFDFEWHPRSGMHDSPEMAGADVFVE